MYDSLSRIPSAKNSVLWSIGDIIPMCPTSAKAVSAELLRLMSNLAQDLVVLLQKVDRPGSFRVSGSNDIYTPCLEVESIGTIALPLLPVQAAQILEVAEHAPYGRGSETLVDMDVRRA